jgi:hypothetical protein
MGDVVVDHFFHSPSRHAKGERPDLGAGERDLYGRLSSLTHPGQMYIYWNSETTSNPGVFTHPSAGKGYSVALSKHMPLAQLTVAGPSDEPQLILTSRWFARSTVIKIPGDAIPAGMTEADMSSVIESLAPSIDGSDPRFVPERTELSRGILNVTSTGAISRDPVEWHAGLHGHGHFAGLFKEKTKDMAGQNNYYLAVHSDSDLVGEALNGFAAKQGSGVTLGQFASSPQMDAVKSYSQRNAYRMLAHMADSLALDRKKVSLVSDLHAAPSGQHEAPPEIVGVPYADTVYNTFYDPVANGQHLIYYSGASRLNALDPRTSRVVMLKNAKHGISIIHLDQQKDYSVFRHNIIAGANESHMVSHGNPHSAMPVGLGRLRGETSAILKMSKLTLDDALHLHRTYAWSGRKSIVRLSGPEDVQANLDKRLYAYKPLSNDLKSLVTFMLGEGTQVTNLKPVKVILPAK